MNPTQKLDSSFPRTSQSFHFWIHTKCYDCSYNQERRRVYRLSLFPWIYCIVYADVTAVETCNVYITKNKTLFCQHFDVGRISLSIVNLKPVWVRWEIHAAQIVDVNGISIWISAETRTSRRDKHRRPVPTQEFSSKLCENLEFWTRRVFYLRLFLTHYTDVIRKEWLFPLPVYRDIIKVADTDFPLLSR